MNLSNMLYLIGSVLVICQIIYYLLGGWAGEKVLKNIKALFMGYISFEVNSDGVTKKFYRYGTSKKYRNTIKGGVSHTGFNVFLYFIDLFYFFKRRKLMYGWKPNLGVRGFFERIACTNPIINGDFSINQKLNMEAEK